MAINEVTSIDVKTLPPFKRLIMTIGELPTSYLESMTYAELLMWFCNFLQEKVLPTINNNADALQEVITYLENLDLQDEVDNKLDEMAESGQLQEIVADYLNSKAVFGYDTIADMKLATNLIDGSYAKTLGYHSKNDGGSALYKIREITNIDVVDNMFILSLADNSLIAELIYNNEINVKTIGAYGDGNHDDTLSLQTGLNKTKNIYLPNGTYNISDTLASSERTTISGENKDNTVIKYTIEEENVKYMIQLGERSVLQNIALSGPYVGNTDRSTYNLFKVCGLNLTNAPYCVLRSCRLAFLRYGVHLADAWCCSFEHCYALRSYVGFDCHETSANNDISFMDCQVEYNVYGAWIGEGRTQSFYNCDFENNLTSGITKQNEGDIQINNCYFEDKMNVIYANTYVSNITVIGSSFFQNPATTSDAYTPITFTGDPLYTRISVINCNFKNLSSNSDTYNTPCILREGNTATNIKPILINNTIKQMKEFDSNKFKGIVINNGKIEDYNNKDFTYLSMADGNQVLNPNSENNINYRMYLPAQGVNRTVTLNALDNIHLYKEYQFIIPETATEITGTVTFTDTATVKIHCKGSTTISYLQGGKLIKLIFIGNYSGYDNWQLIY